MNKGIVCILDVLGTKGIWAVDESHIYLEKLKGVHSSLLKMKDYVKAKATNSVMDYITFSDTIIITLHWEGVENESMIPVFARVVDGMFSECLAADLLMRGAMAYGKFFKEDNIIIGPAIDDAAHWYEQAQLVGCILTPSTTLLYDYGLDIYNNLDADDSYDYSQHAIKYKTPCKGDANYDLYNVNWPLSSYKALKAVELDPLLIIKRILGTNPIPSHAFKKHENTIEFFNYSIKERSN